jgi:hypothetical protein
MQTTRLNLPYTINSDSSAVSEKLDIPNSRTPHFYMILEKMIFSVELRSNMASAFTRFCGSHTTLHQSVGFPGRVISSSQRPIPDNTQHTRLIHIYALSEIRTHNPSKRAATLTPHTAWPPGPAVGLYIYNIYRGADKPLARPGRKQATSMSKSSWMIDPTRSS